MLHVHGGAPPDFGAEYSRHPVSLLPLARRTQLHNVAIRRIPTTVRTLTFMTRHLILVLGDQLDPESAVLDGFDPAADAIVQMEVREEATYIPQHKQRLVFFFSAMRHFRDAQRALSRKVIYRELDDPTNRGTLALELERARRLSRAPGPPTPEATSGDPHGWTFPVRNSGFQ
jgi:hypothetical protein